MICDNQIVSAILALQNIPRMGNVTLKKLLQQFESSEVFLTKFKNKILFEEQSRVFKNLSHDYIVNLETYSAQLHQLCKSDIKVIHWFSSKYPKLLREIYDPPPLLYYRGNLELLTHPYCVAVVGCRQMTAYGKSITKQFTEKLVQHDIVIVSGLAFGIDSVAHQTALDMKGKTIAVLPMGLNCAQPQSQHELFNQILQSGGGVLSEYPFYLASEMEKGHFPKRNRIISGLSRGILVAEAGLKSGAILTAEFALEQNRDVFVIPGSLLQKQSLGCLDLLKQGAQVVTDPIEIIQSLGLEIDTCNQTGSNSVTGQVSESTERSKNILFNSEVEKQVYDFCEQTSATLDQIVESFEIEVPKLLATITRLQMMKLLHEVDGKFTSLK